MNDRSLIGQEIAGYRIEDIIAQGGMAAVYLATDTRLGRHVALKVLSPQLSNDERFRQRFILESRTLAAIDHPNIIPIYEAGAADEVLFIAMRYVGGMDLRMLLDDRGRLTAGETHALLSQVAVALDTAHAHDLIHRDIKPANILIADGGHVYLTDFGITRHRTSLQGLTATNQLFGTPRYMAPEQINKEEIDGRCDQYALACVVYESLGGRPPFRLENDFALLRAHLEEAPEPLRTLAPELPPAVDEVMSRGLAKSPDQRYPTCGAFVMALRDAISGRRAEAPAPARGSRSAPLPRPGGSRRMAVATALAAVVAAAALVAFVLLPAMGGGWATYPGGPAAPIAFEYPDAWSAGASGDLYVVASPRRPEFERLFATPFSSDWTPVNEIIKNDPDAAVGIYTGVHQTLGVVGSGDELQESLSAIMPGTLAVTGPAVPVTVGDRGAVRVHGTVSDPQQGGRLDFVGYVIDRPDKAAYLVYFCAAPACDDEIPERAVRTAIVTR